MVFLILFILGVIFLVLGMGAGIIGSMNAGKAAASAIIFFAGSYLFYLLRRPKSC